jgi:uncharacterized membrane protein YfcA
MISFDVGLAICLLMLGAMGGFLAGLLGIGGGMILVPFLTMLFIWKGMPMELVVHACVATSMAMICFTSLSSMRAHHKRGGILWPVVGALVPGVIVGGLLSGGVVFSFINTAWLALIFAIFVAYSSYNMASNKKPKPSRQLPGFLGTSAMGGLIGFISGLVGAGGGFLTVPFLVWCNIDIRKAVSTSAALGFPIAIANSVGFIFSGIREIGLQPGMLGYVYWPALLVLISTSMLMAPVGASCAHKWPVGRIKKIFAGLLAFIAVYMLRTSLIAFEII